MPSATAEKSSVLVVGAGAVGTMACVALELSGRAEVTAVLRSNYEEVSKSGYSIDSCDHGKLSGWRPSRVVKSVTTAVTSHPFDYLVVTMKSLPDVYSIPDIIRPAVTPGATTIVLIQNGIGLEQPIIDAFPANIVLSGVSMICALQVNGHVKHDGHDELLLGTYYNPAFERAEEDRKAEHFAELYGTTGATCELEDNITWTRWRKLVWNATFNTNCAILRLDCTKLSQYGGEESLLRPAMAEIIAIAKADGHALPNKLIDDMITAIPLDLNFRPSMLVDVDKGNPIEIEVILGNPLRTARKYGVKTPALDYTYRMLKMVQAKLLDAKGWTPMPPSSDLSDPLQF